MGALLLLVSVESVTRGTAVADLKKSYPQMTERAGLGAVILAVFVTTITAQDIPPRLISVGIPPDAALSARERVGAAFASTLDPALPPVPLADWLFTTLATHVD